MYSKHGVYLKFAVCGLIRLHVGTLWNQLFPVRPKEAVVIVINVRNRGSFRGQ